MPLIIISGLPSSGKSTRALQLQEFFTTQGKVVKIVTENIAISKAGFQKNEYFADSQKEKIVRADLKSEALRLLNKDDVVILDAGNYIKGYRYELYCATKSARTSQCTIYCGIPKDNAWQFNCKRSKEEQNFSATDDELNNSDVAYTQEIFDALCLRFEEPHGNSRWDSPLFTIFPEDEINFDEVYKALFESTLPPPNKSTQNFMTDVEMSSVSPTETSEENYNAEYWKKIPKSISGGQKFVKHFRYNKHIKKSKCLLCDKMYAGCFIQNLKRHLCADHTAEAAADGVTIKRRKSSEDSLSSKPKRKKDGKLSRGDYIKNYVLLAAVNMAPLSSTNYLFELDKLTQDVISTVIASRKIGIFGPVKYKNTPAINVPSDMNASQLNRLRRQFLNYNKLHTSTGSNLDNAAQLFVQFLNSNFNK